MNLSELIGLTETDAVAKIKAAGMKSRVRVRDGQAFIGTADYRLDRVNLSVANNLVTGATLG